MYLKGIEIYGFKSFADKVKLNFEKEVSCIVGPNGCGKSNVVDSIRWAIGEMSWKSLRSGSMVDIIFNGTKKRPPLNMAQVSMVFDNAERKLPIDFGEVTVTRKIYRSGESEYLLNRVQCRLKDIREMFLDTGIGGEGYAIIDQGSVNQMIKATPEQRREMFEEVAGVSKYKAKRDEAVRKLERVDMDTARLSDTLVLIEEQIKKLDSEARKARLYQKYREELKESEIGLCLEDLKLHDGQIAELASKLEPLLKNIEDHTASLSALEGECAALDLNLTHKQAELNEFNEKISSAKYQIGLLEGDVQNCQNLTEELTLQLKNSADEDIIGKQRLEELAPVLANLKQKLDEIEKQFTPLQEAFNKKYESLKTNEQNLHSADEDIEKNSSLLMGLSSREMELSAKAALEESSASYENNNLITLEKTLQKQTAQTQSLQQEAQSLQKEIEEKQKNLNALKEKQNSCESAAKELALQKQTLSDGLNKIHAEKAALNAKRQMIETQGQNNPYWIGAKLAQESSIAGVRGTLRKNIKFDQSLTLKIEEAFGKFLDAVLCENKTSAEEAAALLEKRGKARCRFVILDSVPKPAGNPSVTPQGQEILKHISYPSELASLMTLLSSSVKTEGTKVSGSFWFCAGDENVKSPESYWGEEETVKENLKALFEKEEIASHEISLNFDKSSSSEEEIKKLRAKYQEEAILLNSLQNNLANKQRIVGDLNQTSEHLQKNKAQMFSLIEQKKQNAAKLKEEQKALAAQKQNAQKAAEELRSKKTAVQQEGAALKIELEQAQAKLYEVKIKKGNLELDLKGAQNEFNSLTLSAQKRAEQTLKSNERIKTLSEQKISCEAKLSSQRDVLADLELRENKLRGEVNALKTDYDAKNTALSKQKTQINELTLKAHDLENTLSNHRRQKTAVVNTLLENWNTTPEEARMKWGGKPVDLERVKMMRKRIENMGAVNMTAPEEYDALTQRNDFLKKQIADLEQAKKDLKTAIAKINATTRDNFKYTFERVKEHFKNIYQILFVGGEADLILTDPENMLETGVEIMVQPPGKKVLNMSSLSGGEMALTAISLLFAFFTHNPSPFCILDEADAPLDEANIERFVKLIKDFSAKTQFIMVTHNKRTMEAAQMLYGITMEESGVSKVLSLNLKDQDAKTKQLVSAATAK